MGFEVVIFALFILGCIKAYNWLATQWAKHFNKKTYQEWEAYKNSPGFGALDRSDGWDNPNGRTQSPDAPNWYTWDTTPEEADTEPR